MRIEKIRNKLKNRKVHISGYRSMKKYALLVPLVKINNELCIIFEVRANSLKTQPGDICFPGGKIEENESPIEAAVRETEEEIGLKNISIISELDTVIKFESTIIYPFLGEVKNINELKINKSEVNHVFYAPIKDLLNIKPIEGTGKLVVIRDNNFPYELIKGGKDYKFREGKSVNLFYKYKEYIIWGITAEILKNFLEEI